MIKSSFYTMVLKNNKKQAILVNGYSDGTYYYYKKDNGFWSVIHPLCGLSIANGKTRKEAEQMAYTKRVQDGLDNMYKNNFDYYKKLGDEFEKYIQELKKNNRA